ncbi:PDZ and LIM domain protein Zasp-like [Pecten maximus]|uniref:PDZ and LIM domain protein Zasp-like n=1 Tax=Pecten maximus TaxID=6579 RepID=UPI0014589AEE|nr:PDZ and LIM domain protein Zasp-like [Pecten maximus]
MRLQIKHVNPKSVSGQAGLQNGDLIVCIGNMDVTGSTHQKARDEMIRSGNEVDLQVRRGGVAVKSAPPPPPEPEPEDGGSYRDVQPKTYQILEKELPQAAATGARPASIFDRKKQQRSEYTKTDKSGYMKAYGQQ